MSIKSPMAEGQNWLAPMTGETDIVVKRYPLPTLNRYRWRRGEPQEVEIKGVNIQPLKDSEYLLLPEGYRARDWLKIYSKEALQGPREGPDGQDGDRFTYKGTLYEVVRCKPYSMGVLDHYKSLAVSVEKTPTE